MEIVITLAVLFMVFYFICRLWGGRVSRIAGYVKVALFVGFVIASMI